MCCCGIIEAFTCYLIGMRKPLHESDGSRLSRYYEQEASESSL